MEPIDATVTLLEVVQRLGGAMLMGAVLGVNRDLRDKPAGLKTHALVALGASLLTVVSISYAAMTGQLDGASIARVTQGIITGIGFLGAGVIMRGNGEQSVQGLTTAASVWLAACLGIACGAGQWNVALVAWAATLLVLIIGDPIERAIYRRWHRRRAVADASSE